MSQTIVRLFATSQAALDATAELKKNAFRADHMFVVAPPPGSDFDAIAAQIAATLVPKHQAAVYARHLPSGGASVTVHALFGTAMRAMEILDSHNPIESGVAEPNYAPKPWDEAAPLSSALQWSTSFSNPAPISDLLGIPPVINCPTPLSSAIGLPVLSRNPAPFSSMFGLPTTSRKAAPFSSLFGLPTVINCPTPLSSLFKIPTLTKGR